ncbi:MAG: Dabb family protein [Acidimicrobiales bacterium]
MHIHTVLVKLRDPSQVGQCRELMESMRGRIDSMIELRVDINELPGTYACDLALTTSWPHVEAYHAYETDPIHLEVRAQVIDLMESASTIDYTVTNP